MYVNRLGDRFAREWSVQGGVSYTRLGDGLANSPLVSRSVNLLMYSSVTWTFFHRH